jgi:hypothetical protein
MALPPGFSTQATVSATQGSQKAGISLQDIANLALPSAIGFSHIVALSQGDYDAIAVPDPNTLYIVTPDPE